MRNELTQVEGSQLINDIRSFNIKNNIVSVNKENRKKLTNSDVCFYRIERLSYDKDYPYREAFENVIMSMDITSYNFVYILTGNEDGIELDIGVADNFTDKNAHLSANDCGDIIKSTFEGNFGGSILKKVRGKNLESIISGDTEKYKYAGTIVGIPSVNKDEYRDKDQDFQGIDRLIESMLGMHWRIIVVCEPVAKREIMAVQNEVYELYNRLHLLSKLNVQMSQNKGTSKSTGKNYTKTDSTNEGTSSSVSDGTNSSSGSSSSSSGKSHSVTKGASSGTSVSEAYGDSANVGTNEGSSSSLSLEIINKQAQEMLKYIDEELLERLKTGFTKGMFETSIMYMAEYPADANRLKSSIISLFQGNSSTYSPLTAKEFDLTEKELTDIITGYHSCYMSMPGISPDVPLLYGRPFRKNLLGLSTFLTAREISLIAGLPQKEVPGITLTPAVNFGLNTHKKDENNGDKTDGIKLGNMMLRNREIKSLKFTMNSALLSKHTFIAGVTGSGKTTTCQTLLTEAGLPFLVVEPAKTEYRALMKSDRKLIVFTLGDETCAPFRLNPLEFTRGEIISSHIDMVKASFTTAFPMEASMPQLLEEALYKSYEDKGWDVHRNVHRELGDKAFDKNNCCFPMLNDLLNNMREITKSKGFSKDMESDYIGSLVSRLSNLTIGSKGSMLNCPYSVDFDKIIDHNVVIEMEAMKSPEDKALIMGFILSGLSEAVKERHLRDKDFKHLTLVEESHRLLSRVEYGDSGSKKAAVETFTDLLAEVRKYGEGLIIVDQIPNKLAPDVLKNTNTKIIHRILAKDDKEAVGDTMMMDDKQKEFLSALQVGHAVVFNEDMDKPIYVKINSVTDTSEAVISSAKVKERFEKIRDSLGGCYIPEKIVDCLSVFSDFRHELTKKGTIGETGPDKRKCDALGKLLDEKTNTRDEKLDLLSGLVSHAYIYSGATDEKVPSNELLANAAEFILHILENGRTDTFKDSKLKNLIIQIS